MLQKIILILSCYFAISCAGPPPENHIRASGLSPTRIVLKNAQNQYVRLNAKPPYYLIADAEETKADTFYCCDLGHNLVALKARDHYVTIYLPLKNEAVLRQNHIDVWEKLTLEKHGHLRSLKGCNDLYLQPTDGNILTASSAILTDACLFQMIEL